jgi:DegV family protein with EDD domain
MAAAIVTDSTSDIEPARARAMGVTVVPLFVVWGDRSYRDYIDLTRAQFYEKLASEPNLPATSQPSPQMFEDAFRQHAERGDQVVCIVISSKLSGTINAAKTAAGQLPAGSVTIVDSESVAGGLAMQVQCAVDAANAGADVRTVVAAVEREKQAQRLYACIPDLSHVVRTGRIGKAQAAIGTLMKIVPVISLRDGEVVAEAQVRTMSRALQTMIDLSLKNTSNPANARYLVMHTNAPQLAQEMAQRLHDQLSDAKPKSIQVREAGPVIATHGGPGAVGIFSAQD